MLKKCIRAWNRTMCLLLFLPIFCFGKNYNWKFVSGTFSGDTVQACYREDIVSERRSPGFAVIGCNLHIIDVNLAKGTARQKSVSISNILKLDYYNDVHFIGYLSNRLHFHARTPWYANSNGEEELGFIDLSTHKVIVRTGKWPQIKSTYAIWQDNGRGELVGHLFWKNWDDISAKAIVIGGDTLSEYSGDKISDIIINELSFASRGRAWRSFADPSYGVFSMRCKNPKEFVDRKTTNDCMVFAVLENRNGSVRELWKTRIPGWYENAIFVGSPAGKKSVIIDGYYVSDKSAFAERDAVKRFGTAMFSDEEGGRVVNEWARGTLLCRDDCQVGLKILESSNEDNKPIFSERLLKKCIKLIVFDGRDSDIKPKHVNIEIK